MHKGLMLPEIRPLCTVNITVMVFLVAVIKLVSGLFVCLYSTSEFALRCSFLLVVPV